MTFKEISVKLGVHVRTVQDWHSKGLKVLDESRRPFLVYGESLKSFLDSIQSKRRLKLKPDEFYCVKCRKASKAIPNSVNITDPNRRLGSSYIQLTIEAKCEKCGTKMVLFSSDNAINKVSFGSSSTEHVQSLYKDSKCTLNTDIYNGGNNA